MKQFILQHIVFFFILAFIFLGSYLCAQPPQSNPELDANLIKSNLQKSIGTQAPQISFRLIDTKTQDSLSQYKENPVLLFFWNRGCSGCLEEINNLGKLQGSYHDAGLTVMFLSRDDQETQQRFYTTIDINGVKGYITDEKLNVPYPRFVAPAAVLIDQEGMIRDAWMGTLGYDELEKKINLLIPQSMKESGSSVTNYFVGIVSAIFLVLIFVMIRRMK